MTTRRDFLHRGASLAGLALLAPDLEGLVARLPLDADRARRWRAAPGAGGYGELRAAGLHLALPPGFQYALIGEEGRPMSDGRPTPRAFDGMAAFPARGGTVRLVRNHEDRSGAAPGQAIGADGVSYDPLAGGGTTTVEVRLRRGAAPQVVREFPSLSGTTVNCAGGTTPWGSWLSCEETTVGRSQGFRAPHGYVFEVGAAQDRPVRAEPYRAMGRFAHEAVAVDPRDGTVYLTEDTQRAGFYRFRPGTPGRLADGGALEMLALADEPQGDTAVGRRAGQRWPVRWVPIADPDPADADQRGDAVFAQGFALGGARFARLEGAGVSAGRVYFVSTNGGDAQAGQVFLYAPADATLTLLFESPDAAVLDGPDNLCISPRGAVVLAEDGGGTNYVRALTRDGKIVDLARNILSDREFAGPCFSPDGSVLFVNVQGDTRARPGTEDSSPGLKSYTYAIWGPWELGAV